MPSLARALRRREQISVPLTTTLLCGMMILYPHRALAAATPEQLLCGNVVKAYIDAGQFVWLIKAVLQDDHFTAWVSYGEAPDSLKRTPNQRLQDNWGLGYQLDDSPATDIHPLVASTEMTIALSFSHLKPGPHRLRIGFVDPTGKLTQDNAYCFSSPGHFALAGPKAK